MSFSFGMIVLFFLWQKHRMRQFCPHSIIKMKFFCLFSMVCVFALLPISHAETQIWKVHNKSVYGDEPPKLRLENVQIFYPKTGKLSKVINEKPKLPQKDVEEEIELPPDIDFEKLAIQDGLAQQQSILPSELQRRDNCQAAQDKLQQAMQNGETNLQTYEEEVVYYCIVA